ncbi:hypothetical protein HanIR_Chr08g0366671 [Helianthus annuus]|nr:hypothetical protein HanIR_Chr08g0366671 [Helianthus annuus]
MTEFHTHGLIFYLYMNLLDVDIMLLSFCYGMDCGTLSYTYLRHWWWWVAGVRETRNAFR